MKRRHIIDDSHPDNRGQGDDRWWRSLNLLITAGYVVLVALFLCIAVMWELLQTFGIVTPIPTELRLWGLCVILLLFLPAISWSYKQSRKKEKFLADLVDETIHILKGTYRQINDKQIMDEKLNEKLEYLIIKFELFKKSKFSGVWMGIKPKDETKSGELK